MFLGDRVREYAPFVQMPAHELWASESLSRKALALLRLRWHPSPSVVQTQARYWYDKVYFGGDEDYGPHLAILNDWHLRREWTLDALTPKIATWPVRWPPSQH